MDGYGEGEVGGFLGNLGDKLGHHANTLTRKASDGYTRAKQAVASRACSFAGQGTSEGEAGKKRRRSKKRGKGGATKKRRSSKGRKRSGSKRRRSGSKKRKGSRRRAVANELKRLR